MVFALTSICRMPTGAAALSERNRSSLSRNAVSAANCSVTSAAITTRALRPSNWMEWDETSTSMGHPSFVRCFQRPRKTSPPVFRLRSTCSITGAICSGGRMAMMVMFRNSSRE